MSGNTTSSPHVAKKILPYACEQMFDLVADIQRYPEFLPAWQEVKIIAQTDSYVHVSQTLGFPLLTQTFLSTARLERPSRLNIRSSDGPFHNLNIIWQFLPREDEHCEVVLEVRADLKSHLLGHLAGIFHDKAIMDILNRFELRAHSIHGSSRNP